MNSSKITCQKNKNYYLNDDNDDDQKSLIFTQMFDLHSNSDQWEN